ncbi:hypothetical protein AgCh_034262 [Apium graveolens]
MDSSKLDQLGWTSKVSLHDSLVDTYKWYLENSSNDAAKRAFKVIFVLVCAAGTPNVKICVVGAAIVKVLASELPHTGNRKCTVLYPASAKASSEIDEVTLDLDVVARIDLLDFFKAECE